MGGSDGWSANAAWPGVTGGDVYRRRKPRRSWRQGRDWKQPYRKSRRFDKSCRCNGGCTWCLDNRLHAVRVQTDEAIQQVIDAWR